MSHKIIEAATDFGVSLSKSDGDRITTFLGITDKRKNLSDPERLLLKQVCELVEQGKSVTEAIGIAGTRRGASPLGRSAIASINSADGSESESVVESNAEFLSTDEEDLNPIILEQANRAADAALSNLPYLASAEMESLRQAFIQQFRKRIREQLQSTEFQSAFIAKIECQAQLPVRSSTTANTTLPSSLSENS